MVTIIREVGFGLFLLESRESEESCNHIIDLYNIDVLPHFKAFSGNTFYVWFLSKCERPPVRAQLEMLSDVDMKPAIDVIMRSDSDLKPLLTRLISMI